MRRRLEAVRIAFWLPSALGVPVFIVLAFLTTQIDRGTKIELGLFGLSDAASARAVLQTIATATVSVAGLAFSVTLVALTLASQQLSPRVLRTFRADRIAQGTLAGFLSTFAFSLVVLARLGGVSGPRVPELSVGLAIVFALFAFGAFVAFIGDIVVALQASTVIRRIATDAHRAIEGRHPRGIGSAPKDPADAEDRLRARRESGRSWPLTTDAPGYLTDVDGRIIERAAGLDVLVVQRVSVGDFLVSGQEIGEVWAGGDEPPELDGLRSDFRLAPERTLAADVAFPVRQLSDIALKALSPGINDPTTAENAMGSLADTLVRLAGEDPVDAVRVDKEGEPRLCAEAVSLDALVRLGFEQVRHASEGKPVLAERLEALLVQITRSAQKAECSSDEAERQRALLARARNGA